MLQSKKFLLTYLYFKRFSSFFQPGFGKIGNVCKRCACDNVGSRDDRCDPKTAQCPCQPGVGGLNCNRCEDGFFSFSSNGCQGMLKS